jgi:amphi-Trp domain-containing protein
MGPHRQTFLDPHPTAATVLGGIGGWHGDDATASVCCFAFEDGPELCPAGITDALGQVVVLDHVGHLQVFKIDDLVVAHQLERRFMLEVAPLPVDLLVLLGQELHGLAAAFAPLLATGDTALRLFQLSLAAAGVPGILDTLTLSGDEKHLQPNVDTRFPAGWRQELRGYFSTREGRVPAVGFMDNGDRLDRAFEGTTPPDSEAANLGEHQIAVIEGGTVAELLVGEAGAAAASLKAGIARLLTRLYPTEERLEGTVEACEHLLQHLRMDIVVLWSHLFDGGQFGALVGTRDALAAFLPGITALLERGVIEFSAAPEHKPHPLLLLRGRLKFAFEGFAYGLLLVHRFLFCPIATKSASQRAIHPLATAKGLSGQFSVIQRSVEMTNLKFKKEEHVTRVEAAARLTEIAKALRNSAKYELERGGEKLEIELDVPEGLLLEFEVEIENGKTELEIELKWTSASSASTGSES